MKVRRTVEGRASGGRCRPPKRRSRPHDERFEAVRPNHRWALDFLQRYINRTSTFSLFILDDCSRYVVGHGVDDAERADMVTETFMEAVTRHGKPEMVIHDKGAAFTIEDEPKEEHRAMFLVAARRIHATHRVPKSQRNAATRRLAAMTQPIA